MNYPRNKIHFLFNLEILKKKTCFVSKLRENLTSFSDYVTGYLVVFGHVKTTPRQYFD